MVKYAKMKVRDSSGNLTDVIFQNGMQKSKSGCRSNENNNNGDYSKLLNKPRIGGRELLGDMTAEQLGLASKADWGDINTILDSVNGDGTQQVNQLLDEINGEVI